MLTRVGDGCSPALVGVKLVRREAGTGWAPSWTRTSLCLRCLPGQRSGVAEGLAGGVLGRAGRGLGCGSASAEQLLKVQLSDRCRRAWEALGSPPNIPSRPLLLFSHHPQTQASPSLAQMAVTTSSRLPPAPALVCILTPTLTPNPGSMEQPNGSCKSITQIPSLCCLTPAMASHCSWSEVQATQHSPSAWVASPPCRHHTLARSLDSSRQCCDVFYGQRASFLPQRLCPRLLVWEVSSPALHLAATFSFLIQGLIHMSLTQRDL